MAQHTYHVRTREQRHSTEPYRGFYVVMAQSESEAKHKAVEKVAELGYKLICIGSATRKD